MQLTLFGRMPLLTRIVYTRMAFMIIFSNLTPFGPIMDQKRKMQNEHARYDGTSWPNVNPIGPQRGKCLSPTFKFLIYSTATIHKMETVHLFQDWILQTCYCSKIGIRAAQLGPNFNQTHSPTVARAQSSPINPKKSQCGPDWVCWLGSIPPYQRES